MRIKFVPGPLGRLRLVTFLATTTLREKAFVVAVWKQVGFPAYSAALCRLPSVGAGARPDQVSVVRWSHNNQRNHRRRREKNMYKNDEFTVKLYSMCDLQCVF